MNGTTLFKVPENDPFVKIAVAEITRLLDEELETLSYSNQEVQVDDSEVEESLKIIYDEIFDSSLARTHRLSRASKEVNKRYKEEMGEKLIDSPQKYFPNKRDESTQFDENRFDPSDVADVTLLDDDFDNFDSERSIYRLRESFVGNPGLTEFEGALDRAEQSYDVFCNTLKYEELEGGSCSCCGRNDLPTSSIDEFMDESYHYETEEEQEEAVDGSSKAYRVEFGQSMTPYMTKSGRTRPSGLGRGDSYISGRCCACVFLGFYYSLMQKPMDVVSYDNPTYRVLCPTGSFVDLVEVRKILNPKLRDLTEGEGVRTRTLDLIRSESDQAKYLHFFEMVRKGFEKSEGPISSEMLPIGVVSVNTTTDKSNQGVRGFMSFEYVDIGDRVLDIVRSIETAKDGVEEDIDPISELVCRFINIYSNSSDNEPAVEFKDLFCEGIIKDDLVKLERGAFNIYKAYSSGINSLSGNLFIVVNLSKYVNNVMTVPDKIAEEQLEAVRNVGSALGQEFHDEMSVMISLQNASGQAQFLEAFEKAGMQAFKKGSSGASESGYTPHTSDIEKVVELLTDDETFEVTKRLIVIHASFAGHYENLQNNKGEQ